MRNRKAQGTQSMQTIGEFVIIVAALGVILIFMLGAKSRIIGTVSAQTCEKTMDFKNDWDKNLQGVSDSAYIDLQCNFNTIGTGQCAAAGANWFLMGNIVGRINKQNDDLKNWGQSLFMDQCFENVPIECSGAADDVARCLYKSSADTFYALGGGRAGAKYFNDLDEPFNLFEITTRITQPGEINLYGSCQNYFQLSDFPGGTGTLEEQINEYYPGVFQIAENAETGSCDVTLFKLRDHLIVMPMIETCQQLGPSAPACRCFIDTGKGHSVGNGVPSRILGSTGMAGVRANAGPYPAEFNTEETHIGCGGSPDQLAKFSPLIAPETLPASPSVAFDALSITDPDFPGYLEIGEVETRYTRLTALNTVTLTREKT